METIFMSRWWLAPKIDLRGTNLFILWAGGHLLLICLFFRCSEKFAVPFQCPKSRTSWQQQSFTNIALSHSAHAQQQKHSPVIPPQTKTFARWLSSGFFPLESLKNNCFFVVTLICFGRGQLARAKLSELCQRTSEFSLTQWKRFQLHDHFLRKSETSKWFVFSFLQSHQISRLMLQPLIAVIYQKAIY